MASLRPDTQNFNRLLISLGLISVAIAIIGPWFYYRDTSVLSITRPTLSELTSLARASLLERQRALHAEQEGLPYVAGVIFLIGIGLLVWGGKRMHEAQTWEDRGLRAHTKQQEATVAPQTQEEKAQRQREAAEDMLVEKPAAVSAPNIERNEPVTPNRQPTRLSSSPRDDIWRVEREVIDRVTKIAPPGFVFHSEVKAVSMTGVSILLDGLLESRCLRRRDIVVEIKMTAYGASRTRMFADQMLAILTRYRAATGRDCVGWLVMVHRDSTDDWNGPMAAATERLADLLNPFAAASVILERDIAGLTLPDSLLGDQDV